LELIRAGNYSTAIAYVFFSVALSIAGTFAGIMMIKQ
jgi:fluoride ion exporter CrcB/FEX